MRVDRTIEPGRYALHPDGGWQIFTDRAELDFKPVAVVTVKPREPVALDPMAQLAAFGETVCAPPPVPKPPFKLGISRAPGSAATTPAPVAVVTVARPEGGHVGFVTDAADAAAIEAVAKSVRTKAAPRIAARRAAPRPDSQRDPGNWPRGHAPTEATRTATPGDVFRAIADEFGILPAVGASVSCARFKPLVTRDDDADATRAYERAIEERRGRE